MSVRELQALTQKFRPAAKQVIQIPMAIASASTTSGTS